MPKDKYGFKTGLTEAERKDRKRLATIMLKAEKEMKTSRNDPTKYRKASDKYWKASDKLYTEYGVY